MTHTSSFHTSSPARICGSEEGWLEHDVRCSLHYTCKRCGTNGKSIQPTNRNRTPVGRLVSSTWNSLKRRIGHSAVTGAVLRGGYTLAIVLRDFRRRVLSCAVAVGLASGRSPWRKRQRRPPTLTLDQAVQYALEHYPTVRAALEAVNGSEASVSVAKSAYLPRLDSLWQSNRATANNIFGQVLPQSVIPAMSGPVLPAASADSVWGSAAGALFSWEPFDFGVRHATVSAAEAAVLRARAGEALTQLDVQAAVVSAFLNVAGASRAVAALQADLDRRDVLSRAVHTLVDNQLRPGRRSIAQRRRTGGRPDPTDSSQAGVDAGGDRVRPHPRGGDRHGRDRRDEPDRSRAGRLITPGATAHPLAAVHQAAVDVARAQEDVLARTDLPHVYLQSSVFARGSGANPNGQLDGGAGDSDSIGRTGRPVSRSCFPMPSTSPVSAPESGRGRRDARRRRRCSTKRS